MDIPEVLNEYGPLGALVALVYMFLRDRRAANDRLYAVLDETRVLLVEVRELIKHHLQAHDTP